MLSTYSKGNKNKKYLKYIGLGVVLISLSIIIVFRLGILSDEKDDIYSDLEVMAEEKISLDTSWDNLSKKEAYYSSKGLYYNDLESSNEDYFLHPDISWEPYKVDRKVKAVYYTANSLPNLEATKTRIERTNESIINSWVINVKNDDGQLSYLSNMESVKKTGAGRNFMSDINATMNELNNNDIYQIARIVAFKDKIAAPELEELAIKDKDGNIWRDNKGDAWLNPYLKESWDYLIDISKEAALLGYKDIQFDYVRFPTDGRVSNIDYQGTDENFDSQSHAIAGFLNYAREELRDYGVMVTADIFGWALIASDGASVGHHLETLAPNVDVVLPMIYPSHYGRGNFGLDKPDHHPYEVVFKSLENANRRLSLLEEETDEQLTRVRPWLQDFTARYLGAGNYIEYGVDEILDQIQATYDAGYEEWVLWNSGNRYTWEALDPELH